MAGQRDSLRVNFNQEVAGSIPDNQTSYGWGESCPGCQGMKSHTAH